MNTHVPTGAGWRARQAPALVEDEARQNAAMQQDVVPTHWEDLLADRLLECRLPAGILDRLIAEALADVVPDITRLLERRLRCLIRREQRALLQSVDSY